MNSPKAKPFPPAARYKNKVVRSLAYDCEDLVIEIEVSESFCAHVTFRRPVGFRVLDEVDMCEFWNTYSEPNGWLYEVEEGGWMELESSRPRFFSPELFRDLREYLIVDEDCISVMCCSPPEISDVDSTSTKSGLD